MDFENIKRLDDEQLKFYEQQLSGHGTALKEQGCAYNEEHDKKKHTYLREMEYMYSRGARITVEGRDIMPGEFSLFAELIADGKFDRKIYRPQPGQAGDKLQLVIRPIG